MSVRAVGACARAELQIDPTPRDSVQLLYTVKRANLTRLPICRSFRSESRQFYRTITSESDLSFRSTIFWSLQINLIYGYLSTHTFPSQVCSNRNICTTNIVAGLAARSGSACPTVSDAGSVAAKKLIM